MTSQSVASISAQASSKLAREYFQTLHARLRLFNCTPLHNKTDTKIISKPAGPEATIENGIPSLMYIRIPPP